MHTQLDRSMDQAITDMSGQLRLHGNSVTEMLRIRTVIQL